MIWHLLWSRCKYYWWVAVFNIGTKYEKLHTDGKEENNSPAGIAQLIEYCPVYRMVAIFISNQGNIPGLHLSHTWQTHRADTWRAQHGCLPFHMWVPWCRQALLCLEAEPPVPSWGPAVPTSLPENGSYLCCEHLTICFCMSPSFLKSGSTLRAENCFSFW